LFAIGKNKIMELRRADKKFDLSKEIEHLELADEVDEEKLQKENT